ncbi:MAG: site-specific integrase, partial [Spirochaetes bacterium]|nr:site-specific integrase [Spirochaetota bacterium]
MTQAVTVRKPTTPEPFELTKKKAEAACYKAWAVFGEINSFEDLESYFLRGAGLSRYTYRNYRDSFKRLYDFLKGKHPAQVTAADLEAFYDRRLETVDRLTAYLDIRGIKKCFEGMKYAVPGLKSPFDKMPEKLVKKLNRTKQQQTKGTLSKAEIQNVLEFLSKGVQVKDVGNYAIVQFLYSTGLRGEELCSLRYKDIEYDEDEKIYYAVGIGKGEKPFRQEIVYHEAVEVARRYFHLVHGRDPRLEDPLFWTISHGIRPMRYHALYERIKELGEKLKEAGVIRRNVNFTPHLLRRSIITHLYKNGMRIKALRHFSRHSSVETLM